MEKTAKGFLMTGLTVLATLIVYNLFVKAFLPTGIQNLIQPA